MDSCEPTPWLKWIDRLGINAIFRLINRRRPLVLWCHGICDDSFSMLRGYDVRQLPVSLFERKLKHFRRCGYRFVSQDELMDSIATGRPAAKLVTLTFDDGLRNVVKRAYPLMHKYGAKGTFYVVSGLVGKGEILWTDFVETAVRNAPAGDFLFRYRETDINYTIDDEASRRRTMKAIKHLLRSLPDSQRRRHMEPLRSIKLKDIPAEFAMADWGELRGLDPSVLALGNHTMTHPNCARLETEADLEREIYQAGLDISEKIGYPVRHFCYPAGSYNERVLAKLRETGLRSAVTTLPGFVSPTDDPLLMRRIEAEDEWYLFLATTSGAYTFFTRLKARLMAMRRERLPLPKPEPVSAAGDGA